MKVTLTFFVNYTQVKYRSVPNHFIALTVKVHKVLKTFEKFTNLIRFLWPLGHFCPSCWCSVLFSKLHQVTDLKWLTSYNMYPETYRTDRQMDPRRTFEKSSFAALASD